MTAPDPVPVTWHTDPGCQEDEPCWDCATMGNRICGPTDAPEPGTNAPAWMLEHAPGADEHAVAELDMAYEYVSQSGGTWKPLTPGLADALAEGERPSYPWERECVMAELPESTVIACQDGTTINSVKEKGAES
jgi:hypothetical protein